LSKSSISPNNVQVYALAALSDQADTATFHIVRYHQAWMEENRLYIQTELCTSTFAGEMKQGPLSVKRRYKFLREICLALEFIHKNGMVHLDIKPENIFVSYSIRASVFSLHSWI
jgi:wee1-like protein kinase